VQPLARENAAVFEWLNRYTSPSMGEAMNKVKIAAVIIVALLVLIVVLQNTDVTETKLLFVTVTMPRAVLLLVTLVIGFALGVLFAGRLTRKSKQST
jgi:lipopolysaccharide assembly protein A